MSATDNQEPRCPKHGLAHLKLNSAGDRWLCLKGFCKWEGQVESIGSGIFFGESTKREPTIKETVNDLVETVKRLEPKERGAMNEETSKAGPMTDEQFINKWRNMGVAEWSLAERSGEVDNAFEECLGRLEAANRTPHPEAIDRDYTPEEALAEARRRWGFKFPSLGFIDCSGNVGAGKVLYKVGKLGVETYEGTTFKAAFASADAASNAGGEK